MWFFRSKPAPISGGPAMEPEGSSVEIIVKKYYKPCNGLQTTDGTPEKGEPDIILPAQGSGSNKDTGGECAGESVLDGARDMDYEIDPMSYHENMIVEGEDEQERKERLAAITASSYRLSQEQVAATMNKYISDNMIIEDTSLSHNHSNGHLH